MTQVTVTGIYRNIPVEGVAFNLVKGIQTGAKGNYVTVENNGHFPGAPDKIRIQVEDANSVVGAEPVVNSVETETDEEIMDRIGKRFEILHDMTKAVIRSDVRAMIVTGPPGVGKSYGVVAELEKASMFDRLSNKRVKYQVVKGAMTPVGLYATLYKYSDPNHVLVFDDCDSVLLDDLSLNILKAALDSSKKRTIHWNADSAKLRSEGIPDKFDFKGGVIFITNLNFDNIRSKKLQDHLAALQSRCHYLDLSMHTVRDCICRIKQIFRDADLFADYDFTPEVGDEIIEFMNKNSNKLREISLRMALKIADLTKVSVSNWKELAETTCMKGVR